MSETKTQKEILADQATVDPPDNNGGTGGSAALNLTPANPIEPVDPPDNNGGTGGKIVAP